jgi:hypothetical protein
MTGGVYGTRTSSSSDRTATRRPYGTSSSSGTATGGGATLVGVERPLPLVGGDGGPTGLGPPLPLAGL